MTLAECIAQAAKDWETEPNPAGDGHVHVDGLLEILQTLGVWEVVLMATAGEVRCRCFPDCPKVTTPVYRFEYQVVATSEEEALASAREIFEARTIGWTLREGDWRATRYGLGHETVRGKPVGE